MFERFTHEARQIVAEAQAQARGLRHNYIGTEHLLLAILRHGRTPAASILTEIGVGLEPARARVATIVWPGEEESVEQIPFTPRAKQVLEIALREWMSAGNAQVTPEPLVLGLLRQCDGVAQRVIRELASDLDDLRARLVEQLPPRGQAGPQVARPPRAVLAGQEMPPPSPIPASASPTRRSCAGCSCARERAPSTTVAPRSRWPTSRPRCIASRRRRPPADQAPVVMTIRNRASPEIIFS